MILGIGDPEWYDTHASEVAQFTADCCPDHASSIEHLHSSKARIGCFHSTIVRSSPTRLSPMKEEAWHSATPTSRLGQLFRLLRTSRPETNAILSILDANQNDAYFNMWKILLRVCDELPIDIDEYPSSAQVWHPSFSRCRPKSHIVLPKLYEI